MVDGSRSVPSSPGSDRSRGATSSLSSSRSAPGEPDASRPLAGKVVLITGAGRGIGAAIARGFARAGAQVACVARTAEEIEAVRDHIVASGGDASAWVADVADATSVGRAFEAATAEHGGLDVVVVNAGVVRPSTAIAETDDATWTATVATNLTGAFHTIRAAIPHLRARGGGRIVTIGSGLGRDALPGTAAYAASKAGLSALTRAAAAELVADGIAVNELIPGPVATSDDRSVVASHYDHEWRKEPDDVVPLALMLATYPQPGPTGQTFSLTRR